MATKRGVQPELNGDKDLPPEGRSKRSRFREVTLGEATYTVSRLGTRDGLTVARMILGKIRVLSDPILSVMDLAGTEKGAEVDISAMMPEIMKLVEALVEVLDEDELISLTSKLLGIGVPTIAEAPLEDSLNAIADAFDMNNMSALLSAARRIWESASKFVNNR